MAHVSSDTLAPRPPATAAAAAQAGADVVVGIIGVGANTRLRHIPELQCLRTAPPPNQKFWLHGTEGTLRLDVDDGRLEVGLRSEGGELRQVAVAAESRGFWCVEEEWVRAIRGLERMRLTDFETGIRYMEFTEAVARSCQQGCAVALLLLALQ